MNVIDDRKVCPLMSSAFRTPCSGDQCGLWAGDKCAITKLAEKSEDIGERIIRATYETHGQE